MDQKRIEGVLAALRRAKRDCVADPCRNHFVAEDVDND